MKKNKIFIFLLMALPALMLTSCLKDQEDIFDKASSLRMDDYMAQVRETLASAPYGWAFDYYPETEQLYGGYTYALVFDTKQVTVYAEDWINEDTGVNGPETSYYSLRNDMGPVLSFDTYNTLMHYFATPSSGAYQGLQGDFEFVVDSVGTDVIKLHGKKVHGKSELPQNTMYLRKLTQPAATYMAKVNEQANRFFLDNAQGAVNTVFDIDYRQATFNINGEEVTRAYTFTDRGIRLYSPVNVNGTYVADFNYDDNTMKLTSTEAPNLSLQGDVVDDYLLRVLGLSSTTLALGDDEAVNKKEAYHHNLYTFETTADWLTITTEGNNIVMTVQENASGHMRSGTLTYTRADGRQGQITVAQVEFDKDIAGTYQLKSGNNPETSYPAVFRKNEYGGYEFGVTIQDQEVVIPVTYDANSAQFRFGSALFWGEGDFKPMSGGVVGAGAERHLFVYPIFFYGNGYWTAYNTGTYYYGDIVYDEEVGATVAELYGRYNNYDLEALAICGFVQKTCAADTWGGYLDQVYYPYFIK
ncbi:MAG: DUF4302 domain-containing protein [Prevotella sp.]|nr:DUF4302 domain-containing protein [Prevotella sp.]